MNVDYKEGDYVWLKVYEYEANEEIETGTSWMLGKVTKATNYVLCIASCLENSWTPGEEYTWKDCWQVEKKLSEEEARIFIRDNFLEIAR